MTGQFVLRVICCLPLLVAAGVILRIILEDMEPDDLCPYCSGPARSGICPHCQRSIGKR